MFTHGVEWLLMTSASYKSWYFCNEKEQFGCVLSTGEIKSVYLFTIDNLKFSSFLLCMTCVVFVFFDKPSFLPTLIRSDI